MFQTDASGQTVLGPDGHPIPALQGLVTGEIKPMHVDDMAIPTGLKSFGKAKGVALYLPQFEHPPTIVAGTKLKADDGTEIDGTGVADPTSVACKPETLDRACEAADRVIAMLGSLPLTESSVDVMNLAFAVRHYRNKEGK